MDWHGFISAEQTLLYVYITTDTFAPHSIKTLFIMIQKIKQHLLFSLKMVYHSMALTDAALDIMKRKTRETIINGKD